MYQQKFKDLKNWMILVILMTIITLSAFIIDDVQTRQPKVNPTQTSSTGTVTPVPTKALALIFTPTATPTPRQPVRCKTVGVSATRTPVSISIENPLRVSLTGYYVCHEADTYEFSGDFQLGMAVYDGLRVNPVTLCPKFILNGLYALKDGTCHVIGSPFALPRKTPTP